MNDGDRPNVPKLFNLRTDPVERADITSSTDWDRMVGRGILVLPASALVGQFLRTCKDFPPRQKAASFTTIDQAVARLEASRTTGQWERCHDRRTASPDRHPVRDRTWSGSRGRPS